MVSLGLDLGRCTVQRCQLTFGLAGLPIYDWRGSTPALPNRAYWSGRQLTMRHPEKCFAVISAGTANVAYSAALHAEGYEESGYSKSFEL